MRERGYQIALVALLTILVMQVTLHYMKVDHAAAQAQEEPTATVSLVPATATREVMPTATATLLAATETPAPATPESEPEITATATEEIDLVQTCAWVSRLESAERVYAFSQMEWAPDYEGAKVVPSCNLVAGNKPKAVVLHTTQGELSGAIARFQQKDEASAHYIVDRDGTVYQAVPERYGAKHVNCWGQRSYCLAACPICEDGEGRLVEPYLQSVGIEIVNQGAVDPKSFAGPLYEDYNMAFGYRYWEEYPEVQLESVNALVEDICARWGIPLDIEHVIGHSLVNMKSDPGPALNLFWPRYGAPAREALWP